MTSTPTAPVTMFTTSWCGYCVRLKRLMQTEGIDFAEVNIEVDPQNYQVKADGQLLWCEPAEVLPMAQRYFLF